MNAKSILVVDDETHILHVVSLKLRYAGFNVLTARDGEEAMDALAATPVDLIITDFQMPGINGVELAGQVHATAARRHLPIILLTAHGLTLEPGVMERAGIVLCLSKPFSPREILSRVTDLLAPALVVEDSGALI